jgi:ABC-type Mn2+/Zn2+ transport system ATPase subunit
MVATHDLNMAADRFDRVLLLNRRLVAYGEPKDALTQPSLVDAYGGHVHLLESETGLMVLTDSCCDGEEHGTHD